MLDNLSVAICAHVSREKHIPYLLSRLGDVPVFMDDGSLGVWGNHARARAAHDHSKEFHLIVEDDSLICRDFYAHLERLLARWGGGCLYSLFYRHRFPALTALAEKSYASDGAFQWHHWHTANANIVPTKLIPSMLEAGRKSNAPVRDPDRRFDVWIRENAFRVIYPVPSLVDHRPELASLIGHGRNHRRVATWFRGE